MGGTGSNEDHQRAELAAFLRARREELQPEDVGLARIGRRRVRGLRRHEVADLAAVSVTLYTWLEQGRNVGVSLQALDAVARALQLGDDGVRYVRRLAGAPMAASPAALHELSDDVLALVDDLRPNPAYLTTGSFDLITWNDAFARIFVDPSSVPEHRRNGLSLLFTPELTSRLRDRDTELEELIARFRSASGKYPDDPRFAEVVADLTQEEPDFAAVWERHEARRFRPRTQIVDHPEAGTLRFTMLELRVIDHSGVTLVLHRASDAATRTAVEAQIEDLD